MKEGGAGLRCDCSAWCILAVAFGGSRSFYRNNKILVSVAHSPKRMPEAICGWHLGSNTLNLAPARSFLS